MRDAMLERLMGHNAWATRVVLEQCRALDAEAFERRFDIGPGSLHDTLVHVIGAMRRWADRIADHTVRSSPEVVGARRDVDTLLALLDEAARDLAVASRAVAADERMSERMAIEIPGRDDPLVMTRGTAVAHVLTHGVHHRAQVLNMLRRLGVEDRPDLSVVDWELAVEGG